MPNENLVQWVYSSRNKKELEERYGQWASTYEHDLQNDFQWKGPERAVKCFARYVANTARILDAGAGTGLVGEALSALGYEDLIAMDLSNEMLEEADKKNVYAELHQMTMGEPLLFPSASFDAVISVGVLTLGHAPPSSLDELVRVTNPGGIVVFTLRPDIYETMGFKEKQSRLEFEEKWKLLEVSSKFRGLPKGEPKVVHQVWVYQIMH